MIMSVPFGTLMIVFFFLPLTLILTEALGDSVGAATRLFSDRSFLPSLIGSFILASSATLGSLLIGLFMAIYLSRLGETMRQIWSFLISLPLVFSGIIVAYGFILAFGRAGFITTLSSYIGFDPQIVGGFIFTPYGLALAYCYYLIPRVVFIVLPVLMNFDNRQLKAAHSCGASPFKAFLNILLPQLYPALITAGTVVFSVAFGAYGTALALSGTQLNILPLLLYSKISDGGTDFPVIALLSMLLLFICTLLFLSSEVILHRSKK